MTRSVLVLNSGSSSVKYAVVEPDSGNMVADGIVERIGEGPVADHAQALQAVFDQLAASGQPVECFVAPIANSLPFAVAPSGCRRR